MFWHLGAILREFDIVIVRTCMAWVTQNSVFLMFFTVVAVWFTCSHVTAFHTYLLTAWNRVLLEKLTDSQPIKKLPAFYGTHWFITAFTKAHHLSLSWARSIQSISPHPTSWGSIWIFSHLLLGLPSGFFPTGFPIKIPSVPILSPYMLHSPPISFSI